MRFPQFWCRVNNDTGRVVARGWSDSSLQEAQENAQRRLDRILLFLKSGRPGFDEYNYVFDNVICEEVIDRVFAEEVETAVISRNAYGALVMNTQHMMFADIDIHQPTLSERFRSWFSRRQKPLSAEEQTLDELRKWQQSNPQYSLRVYRTRAGFRAIVINHYFNGADDAAIRLLEELKSDRLYRRLCRSQNCFRARLSPKPWRIGAGRQPSPFPFPDLAAERSFQAWFENYVQLAKGFSVCRFIETLGSDGALPRLAPLVDQHDQLCCGDLPLA